jgi:hypothetical protein
MTSSRSSRYVMDPDELVKFALGVLHANGCPQNDEFLDRVSSRCSRNRI